MGATTDYAKKQKQSSGPGAGRVQFPQLDAVLPLVKPSGPSSAQCLVTLKRQGQRKIGHAGTLDPLASGVLIVLLGQATKLAGYINKDGLKIYQGRLRLGLETDTWDSEGRPLAEKPFDNLAPADVESAMHSWLANNFQEVPPYSAAKHEGQPLYKLARKGQNVPVKVKPVKIHKMELLAISLPFVSFRVACSSGTYIRSLAHSLGVRLGCGACLCELVREYSYPFALTQACPWEDVQSGNWQPYAKSLFQALPGWPVMEVGEAWAAKVRNGAAIPARNNGEHVILACNGAPLALARYKAGSWVIERGLWNN